MPKLKPSIHPTANYYLVGEGRPLPCRAEVVFPNGTVKVRLEDGSPRVVPREQVSRTPERYNAKRRALRNRIMHRILSTFGVM